MDLNQTELFFSVFHFLLLTFFPDGNIIEQNIFDNGKQRESMEENIKTELPPLIVHRFKNIMRCVSVISLIIDKRLVTIKPIILSINDGQVGSNRGI